MSSRSINERVDLLSTTIAETIAYELLRNFRQLRFQGTLILSDFQWPDPDAVNLIASDEHLNRAVGVTKRLLRDDGFELLTYRCEADRLGKRRFIYSATSRKPARVPWGAVVLLAVAVAVVVSFPTWAYVVSAFSRTSY